MIATFAFLQGFLLLCSIVPSTINGVTAEAEGDLPAILSSYHVSTNVKSRMATTSIDMVFENPNPSCSDTRSLTLQLPRDARLTDLTMDLSDGCELNSTVKALEAAKQDFQTMSDKGQAAALVTAKWDMTNYNLKVSIPPNGTTNVLLKYQELLLQRLGMVRFQVPFFPRTYVRKLQIFITVEDEHSGILEFSTDDLAKGKEEIRMVRGVNTSRNSTTSFAQYIGSEIPSDSSLPTLLKAYYRPGPLPDPGLMLTHGKCFSHLFNPSAFLTRAGSMARKIVFVIDVSGSMAGLKLADAKASFASMIDTLDERDTLIVQTFSDKGTEKLWGPKLATDGNKAGAKEVVMALHTLGSTNLNQAFTDGIANVYNVSGDVVPVLVILTDGQGNVGPKVTASSVLKVNEGQKVKIFSLAFGFDADMDLLLAIAIQNGGRAARIYEGFGDAATQMELFYKRELGKIMLSDIDVSYDFGGVSISESTVTKFPVLASGSEIVVRGKVDSPLSASGRALKSTIVANSAVGPKEWSVEYPIIQDDTDCRSSFAQARIVELLEYRDAERALGDDLFRASAVKSTSNTSSFEDQAREIALDARLVWPGLTALVTLENTSCQLNTYKVCSTAEGDGHGLSESEEETGRDAEVADAYSASPPYRSGSAYMRAPAKTYRPARRPPARRYRPAHSRPAYPQPPAAWGGLRRPPMPPRSYSWDPQSKIYPTMQPHVYPTMRPYVRGTSTKMPPPKHPHVRGTSPTITTLPTQTNLTETSPTTTTLPTQTNATETTPTTSLSLSSPHVTKRRSKTPPLKGGSRSTERSPKMFRSPKRPRGTERSYKLFRPKSPPVNETSSDVLPSKSPNVTERTSSKTPRPKSPRMNGIQVHRPHVTERSPSIPSLKSPQSSGRDPETDNMPPPFSPGSPDASGSSKSSLSSGAFSFVLRSSLLLLSAPIAATFLI